VSPVATVDCQAGDELRLAEDLDTAAARLQHTVERACTTSAPWPQRIAAGLRALVATCAADPGTARLLGPLPLRLGPLAASRQSALFATLSPLLRGPAAPAKLVPPPLLAGLGEILLATLAEPDPDLDRLADDLTAIALRPHLAHTASAR